VTDVNNIFESVKQNSGDEDSVTSSEKDGQQSHVSDLVALKSGFDNLQKSFDVLRKKFEHSEDITLFLRTEVSHIKDRLGDSEGEFVDSESERSSDDSNHAASLNEQGRTSLFENRVDWTEKDEEEMNDLLEKVWTTLKFFDDSSEAVGEGETLERLEDERKDESWERDEPALDEGPMSGDGADAAGLVSELDHPGGIRSPGQLGETTCEDTLQSIPFSSERSVESRSQGPFFSASCPRCLKRGHELRACPYKAETMYLHCCERWGRHSEVCRGQVVTRSSIELRVCPRCLQMGHRVRECSAEAVTPYVSCCKQWKLHHPGCMGTLNLQK
jgi:hypothetical protein